MSKVKYGLSNVHYAVITYDEEGTATYAQPVAIPGAVTLTADPSSTDNPFHADNIVYFRTNANNGYSGSLEIALVPESFKVDVLGYLKDSAGMLVETASAKTKEFALLGQFETDTDDRKWVFYRCTASRPGAGGTTITDSVTPETETFDLQMMPRISDKYIHAVADKSSSNYATWMTTVAEPAVTDAPGV